MLLLSLSLLALAAEPDTVLTPHTPHAELGVTASRGLRAPYVGLSGGWDGRFELMGRAELWPHTRADDLEEVLDVDVNRPVSHARIQLRGGYDVVDGVRLGAVVDTEHGLGTARPYSPDEGPQHRRNLWIGARTAVGPTIDAWRVRGVFEGARTPSRQGFAGREFGTLWRTWLDVDVHHQALVFSAEAGLGQRRWRRPDENASSTGGLQPITRITIGARL